MLNIGIKITALRKQNKWSQADLANAVNASRDIIGKYERNENAPSIEMAQKIAVVYGVTVDYLIGKSAFANYNQKDIKRLEDRNANARQAITI
ncbi:MAG: helix-turn-helix domain-containing protein [Bacteroidales bacterium]|nr:helix-turn-helix domain-containing protein [Bacteroidales bacterium]